VQHVAGDGIGLHVEVVDGSGPTVVLVHGFASTVQTCWRHTGVLDRLGRAGLRVVEYDARGHGGSDAPTDDDRYGDDRLVADLAEIVDVFSDRPPLLLGYSMGASTALLAMQQGLEVAAAVLGGLPPAIAGWTAADESMKSAAVAALRGEPSDPGLLAWAASITDSGFRRDALAALMARHHPTLATDGRELPPTTVVVGRDDEMAARPDVLAQLLPAADVRVVDGDHVGALLSPALTDAVTDLATRFPG
jgi:pimeloyl-ACP methyl ester carboxylesterase